MTDTQEFVTAIDDSIASLGGGQNLFDTRRELFVTRAPGRLDLMGGIADYSGSLVLPWPIQSAVHVAIQRQSSKTLRIASLPEAPEKAPRLFEITLDELLGSEYSSLCRRFNDQPESRWAAYVAGAFPVLMRETSTSFHDGAHILIQSAVPEGKGVSSSAALEVASMQALVAAFELNIPAQELALLCQKVRTLW